MYPLSLSRPPNSILADPGVTPNESGLPGIEQARELVGAILTYGLIACVAGLVISALVWALSAHNGNSHYAVRGKVGVVVAAAAALLVGGADAIISFFQDAGGTL